MVGSLVHEDLSGNFPQFAIFDLEICADDQSRRGLWIDFREVQIGSRAVDHSLIDQRMHKLAKG